MVTTKETRCGLLKISRISHYGSEENQQINGQGEGDWTRQNTWLLGQEIR